MTQQEIQKWWKSILICFGIFILFSFYLFLRRGYYNLYIINKVLGSTAAVLVGLTLVIGPLAKRSRFMNDLLSVRKQLGLTALMVAGAHVAASLMQQNKFPFPSWYIQELIPIFFGVSAILVWVYMTYISRNTKIKEMGADKWKHILSLSGQLAFIAIFLHLTLMKYQGWLRWWNGQVKITPELAHPSYPPASVFVFIVMLFVIGYRIHQYFSKKKTC